MGNRVAGQILLGHAPGHASIGVPRRPGGVVVGDQGAPAVQHGRVFPVHEGRPQPLQEGRVGVAKEPKGFAEVPPM